MAQNKMAKYNLELFNQLPIRAKELIFEEEYINDEMFLDIDCYLKYLQSPIEKILLTAMSLFIYKHKINLFYEVQKEIVIDEKKYISDFYIECDKYVNPFLKDNFKLVIECDGYEYHHKNKEQVEKDYNRENKLKLNGYDVIRFTGSKIFREPMECVKEIINYIKIKGVDRNE